MMMIATLVALFVVFPVILVRVLHLYGHARSRPQEQQWFEDEAQARALRMWQAGKAQRQRASERSSGV